MSSQFHRSKSGIIRPILAEDGTMLCYVNLYGMVRNMF